MIKQNYYDNDNVAVLRRCINYTYTHNKYRYDLTILLC